MSQTLGSAHSTVMLDAAGLGALMATFLGYFPQGIGIAATTAAFFWYAVQLYGSKPAQRFLRARRRRRFHARRRHVHKARRHKDRD